MQVAEVGKTYEYNGKKYVARPPLKTGSCEGCDMYEKHMEQICPCVIRNGYLYTCIDKEGTNEVIFKDVENVKKN